MSKLMQLNCDYLLLPRPWLNHESCLLADAYKKDADANTRGLYVRGDALIGGRTVSLPYWHKVVLVKTPES